MVGGSNDSPQASTPTCCFHVQILRLSPTSCPETSAENKSHVSQPSELFFRSTRRFTGPYRSTHQLQGKEFDTNIQDIGSIFQLLPPELASLVKWTNAQFNSLDLLWDVSYRGQQRLTLQVKLIGEAAGPDEGSCVHI